MYIDAPCEFLVFGVVVGTLRCADAVAATVDIAVVAVAVIVDRHVIEGRVVAVTDAIVVSRVH